MGNFPVTNSNLSAIHLADYVKNKYGWIGNVACSIIKSGINDTYLVKHEDDKYIFRVYSFNWRTEAVINEEIKLLNLIHNNNIAVSYAIKDKNGIYVQTFNAPEGLRYAVLFSYAQGQKLHLTAEDTHYEIGVLMARMHKITANQSLNRVTYTSKILLDDSLTQLSKFISTDCEEMAFMQRAQQYLHSVLDNEAIAKMRKGIVHLDIWFDNLNITEENKITLFDFDFCGNGWLALDIAYYIMQLHNIERYDAVNYQPKVDSFMKGYESIIPISKQEKELLPALGVSLYFFYLGTQCQRYDNWSNSFLSENYLKRFINGLVKKYYDIYKLGQ
jgi:Ser/Thr protein kinase RdoA (MazF antagonist)